MCFKCVLVFLLGSGMSSPQMPVKAVNPTIARIVSEISEAQISATQKKLESFVTRNIYSSQTDPEHGIGAARHWILNQFHSFSPQLQVSFDEHGIRSSGHVYKDVRIYNVVAVLPGTSEPERRVIVSGHYDTINLIFKTDASGKRVLDEDAIVNAPAPGVTDDGSGTAAVLELARVMSQYKFRKTIVFIAFAGEEYGLLGSSAYAEAAKSRSDAIEAVLNNDIIGSDSRGDGSHGNQKVNVYSEGPEDSSSREVARYMKETGEKYLPEMDVNLVFRHDRFGRGGDHSPFNANGYAAVRVTTPYENYSHQHTATDNFENTAPAYTTKVAKINAATLASMALAPKAPDLNPQPASAGQSSALSISRGESGYDASLRWKSNPEPDILGYSIVIRNTTAPDWQREVFAGNVRQYTLPGVSIDEVVIGIRAVDKDGNESVVSAYVNPPYKQHKWQSF